MRLWFSLAILLVVACSTGEEESVEAASEAITTAPEQADSVASTCPTGPWNVWSMPPGCWRPFRADSAYNTPLPANPREWGRSEQIVARMLGDQAPKRRVGNIVVRRD